MFKFLKIKKIKLLKCQKFTFLKMALKILIFTYITRVVYFKIKYL